MASQCNEEPNIARDTTTAGAHVRRDVAEYLDARCYCTGPAKSPSMGARTVTLTVSRFVKQSPSLQGATINCLNRTASVSPSRLTFAWAHVFDLNSINASYRLTQVERVVNVLSVSIAGISHGVQLVLNARVDDYMNNVRLAFRVRFAF